MKICQYAFGGHSKDGEAGASGEGDPQTNAFTGEGIKPWALKVRVGLNCAGLLKIQQKHLFFFFFFYPLNVSDASDWMYEKNTVAFFIEVVCEHFSPPLRCKYLYQAGEST